MSEQTKLTPKDKREIVYFLQERNDITRWVSYEEKKHLIEKEYSVLIMAIQQQEVARSAVLYHLERIMSEDAYHD